MKRNCIYNFAKYLLLAAALPVITSCSKDFLDPDALSFFEPSTTFTTREGLQAALTSCDRQAIYCFMGEGAPMYTDLSFSDVVVSRKTDKSTPAQNMDISITPTSQNNNVDYNKTGWFWDEWYRAIRFANTVVSNIDDAEGLDKDTRDEMLSVAYFHRAWRYYNLVFQFGDVPLLTQEAKNPKFNYHSSKIEVIIQKMISDLEFAAEHAPVTANYGNITRGACRHLLVKFYLAANNFDKAIEQADILINQSGYSLMKEPFGEFVNPMPAIHNITRNVIWDLHRPENKAVPANKEVLWVMTQDDELDNSRVAGITMRTALPWWSQTGSRQIITPDGKQGMSTSYIDTKDNLDLRKTYGRGVAFFGGTWYSTHTIWDDADDLRHSRETGNWVCMEDLVYNNPALKGNSSWYGKNLRLYDDNGMLLCADTIANWFDWPHYKLWIEDPRQEKQNNYNGGAANWYIFRLAETYLLRAEAYFWKGELQLAANDVNEVRKRARCTTMFNAGDMDMGVIMDERARELTYEELRHVELVRASYIFARTSKADEFGKTYTVEGLSQNSYWYERVNRYNNFYNKGVKTLYGNEFKISPYHIFWPVPQAAIDANRTGRINQNYGYSGYENNEPPYSTLEEAVAGEQS
ncbi:MAG: RagB/SusD family nutrient uptake outer membrane protein [Bacteroides oleiciplenus]|nr:RagB/SusD family nutrient uptake outer membrane protein [Bacteroides oleiciplenus]